MATTTRAGPSSNASHRAAESARSAIRLSRGVLAQIREWRRRSRPRECAGVLGGSGGVIRAVLRVDNLAPLPNRFELDPLGLLRGLRALHAAGLDHLGYFHTHPGATADASGHDVAGALWPDLAPNLHLIVADEEWHLYRTGASGWRRLPCLVSGDGPAFQCA